MTSNAISNKIRNAAQKTGRVAEVLPTPRRPWPNHQLQLEEWMSSMITHPAQIAHVNLDAAARHRADRLARVTSEQMHAALAYLSVIDPEAFEIALTVVPACDTKDPEDEEPFPACRECGAPGGLVAWLLPDEGPEAL
jgi:hypothetical protein